MQLLRRFLSFVLIWIEIAALSAMVSSFKGSQVECWFGLRVGFSVVLVVVNKLICSSKSEQWAFILENTL